MDRTEKIEQVQALLQAGQVYLDAFKSYEACTLRHGDNSTYYCSQSANACDEAAAEFGDLLSALIDDRIIALVKEAVVSGKKKV